MPVARAVVEVQLAAGGDVILCDLAEEGSNGITWIFIRMFQSVKGMKLWLMQSITVLICATKVEPMVSITYQLRK